MNRRNDWNAHAKARGIYKGFRHTGRYGCAEQAGTGSGLFISNSNPRPRMEKLVMKKLAKISAIRQLAQDTKGATMVEYALMLFLILVVAAAAIKTLGTTVNTAIGSASTGFTTH